MKKAKELYLFLDEPKTSEFVNGKLAIHDEWIKFFDDHTQYIYYVDTLRAINSGEKIICTTILDFLSFRYAERLFVVYQGNIHEITLGDCEGTNREIREAHNLPRMLVAGTFDWF